MYPVKYGFALFDNSQLQSIQVKCGVQHGYGNCIYTVYVGEK